MRPQLLALSLTAALTLSGGALAAEGEEPEIEFAELSTDPAGDATAFVIDDVMPASEDTVDLTDGEIGFDHDAETVIFRIGVLDLTELPPAGALGKTFYVNFGYGSGSYYVVATDHVAEGASFGLGSFTEQGLRSGLGAATVTGSFDYEANVVQIELSAEAFLAAVPDAAPFAEGAVISSTDLLAQRYIGSALAGGATPTADTAFAWTFKIPAPPEDDDPEA